MASHVTTDIVLIIISGFFLLITDGAFKFVVKNLLTIEISESATVFLVELVDKIS